MKTCPNCNTRCQFGKFKGLDNFSLVSVAHRGSLVLIKSHTPKQCVEHKMDRMNFLTYVDV